MNQEKITANQNKIKSAPVAAGFASVTDNKTKAPRQFSERRSDQDLDRVVSLSIN